VAQFFHLIFYRDFMVAVKNFLILAILAAAAISCHDSGMTESAKPPDTPFNPLDTLPKDTGGKNAAIALGQDGSPYGYLFYTPSGYKSTGVKFPLLIFLHGSGEIGNSTNDATELNTIAIYGPPELINNGTWSPKYPMIVASPQCHESWWDYQKVKQFIEFVSTTYKVDTTRIYLTGISMGGYGTYDQLTAFGKGSHLAAAVPISGSGTLSTIATANASEVPLWSFHGEADTVVSVSFDKAIHTAINALDPKIRAKLTVYPGTGHDCWTETYNGTGMGKEDPAYDPFAIDVFTWMLQFKRE
jgi:predicted peptidase